jgi:hypothetical protein
MQQPEIRFPPAPRRVPLSLRILAVVGGFAQIGWAVFGFSTIFVWTFVANADLPFSMTGDLAMAAGRVTSVERTGASENKTRVMANHYEYTVLGRRFEGVSYTTGSSVAPGDLVVVQYRPDDPSRSRIEGMRRRMFGPVVLIVLIFPLVGLVFIIAATWGGMRRARLLKDGILTTGKLLHSRPTNMTVNKRRVYELTFSFTSYDGRPCEAKARTSQTERLEDEELEPLLYDPLRPNVAYLLDEVPARPQVNEAGELRGRPLAAAASLLLPALVIVGNLLAARG